MTICEDKITLWDDGHNRLALLSVAPEMQYHHIPGEPCVTFGLEYSNAQFSGCDMFTLFGKAYRETCDTLYGMWKDLKGSVRLVDTGYDTDGYLHLVSEGGRVEIQGQLGATFLDFWLRFTFSADQTLLLTLLQALTTGEQNAQQ